MFHGVTSEDIIFPTRFKLKAILESIHGDDSNKQTILNVLNKVCIEHENDWGQKASSEGKYTSYSIHVTVLDLASLRLLYHELKQEPTIKFAL